VRKVIVPIVVGMLLILAMLPWLVTSCSPQSLVPNDIRQEPLQYDATVSAAQAATINAVRSATSVISVIPIGTIDMPSIVTQSLSTSVVVINTVTASPNSEISPASVSTGLIETPTPIFTSTKETEGAPSTPIGLIDTEDIITEEQLTEQLKTEPEGSELKDLNVTLLENGFQINSGLSMFPVNNQQVEVHGVFIIKNYSLVVSISSITLNGDDVTSSYHEEIESRMDTSLYRLLPERYVQSFIILNGRLLVSSKFRR